MSAAEDPRASQAYQATPSGTQVMSERAFWLAIALFTALGLAVRFGYIAVIDPQIGKISDATGYYQMGKYLAEGRGYIWFADLLYSGKIVPTAAYPPLFPFALSLLHRIGITSLESQHLAIAIMGSVNIPLIALLGRAFGGGTTGIVAGGMATLSPALIEIDGSFMSEAVYVPLVTAAFVCALRACARGRRRDWILTGALLGFAALARSEALMLLPALALPLVWFTGGKRRTVLTLAAIVGFGLVVLPWTIRNALQVGAFVPVSQNYKGAIRGANCWWTYDDPAFLGGWVYGCVADAFGVKGLSEAEKFDRARALGINYAIRHREQLPRVLGARLLRTWGLHKPDRWLGLRDKEVRSSEFARRTWYYGWVLLALTPVGLLLLASRSHPQLWIALCPMLVVSAATLIGYGNPRFRAAAEPSLIALAALSLTTLRRFVSKRSIELLRRTKAA